MQTSEENKPLVHRNSTTASKLLEIERDINVPVNQLFQAFTNSNAIEAWWWPNNLYADESEIDFVEGGRYFINMKGVHEGTGGMAGRYEKIIENKQIVMTDQFANEYGQPISAEEAKVPGSWPETVYITFDFAAINESKSHLKLCQQGIPNEAQADCQQGWNEMFDKLERYLGANQSYWRN